jgi:hypothetical protein
MMNWPGGSWAPGEWQAEQRTGGAQGTCSNGTARASTQQGYFSSFKSMTGSFELSKMLRRLVLLLAPWKVARSS